jgi:hypothetical protein
MFWTSVSFIIFPLRRSSAIGMQYPLHSCKRQRQPTLSKAQDAACRRHICLYFLSQFLFHPVSVQKSEQMVVVLRCSWILISFLFAELEESLVWILFSLILDLSEMRLEQLLQSLIQFLSAKVCYAMVVRYQGHIRGSEYQTSVAIAKTEALREIRINSFCVVQRLCTALYSSIYCFVSIPPLSGGCARVCLMPVSRTLHLMCWKVSCMH